MENQMQNYEETVETMKPVDVTITDQIGIGTAEGIHSDLTKEDVETEVKTILTFRKEIERSAPAVCFDGRFGVEALELGPHLAGGAKSPMVAAATFNHRLQGKELVEDLATKGFTLGAHCDSTNKEAGFANGTGCGANDKIEAICQCWGKDKQAFQGLMQATMGADFDQNVFDSLTLVPDTTDKNYLKDTVGEDLTETLLDDHEGVHGHREIMIVLNYEPGTTIDRDAYFKATGKQIFVIDVWYIKELSSAMAEGVDAESQASNFYHAMMAFQLATYDALCDGSHRAAVLTPSTEDK